MDYANLCQVSWHVCQVTLLVKASQDLKVYCYACHWPFTHPKKKGMNKYKRMEHILTELWRQPLHHKLRERHTYTHIGERERKREREREERKRERERERESWKTQILQSSGKCKNVLYFVKETTRQYLLNSCLSSFTEARWGIIRLMCVQVTSTNLYGISLMAIYTGDLGFSRVEQFFAYTIKEMTCSLSIKVRRITRIGFDSSRGWQPIGLPYPLPLYTLQNTLEIPTTHFGFPLRSGPDFHLQRPYVIWNLRFFSNK